MFQTFWNISFRSSRRLTQDATASQKNMNSPTIPPGFTVIIWHIPLNAESFSSLSRMLRNDVHLVVIKIKNYSLLTVGDQILCTVPSNFTSHIKLKMLKKLWKLFHVIRFFSLSLRQWVFFISPTTNEIKNDVKYCAKNLRTQFDVTSKIEMLFCHRNDTIFQELWITFTMT